MSSMPHSPEAPNTVSQTAADQSAVPPVSPGASGVPVPPGAQVSSETLGSRSETRAGRGADRRQAGLGLAGGFLGDLNPQASRAVGAGEAIAIAIAVLWTLLVVAIQVLMPEAAAEANWDAPLLRLMSVMLPVALLLVAAIALRSARIMREESARLNAAIHGLRNMYLSQSQSASAMSEASVAKRLEELMATARKTESVLATFQTSRRLPDRPAIPARAMEAVNDQGLLALEEPKGGNQPPLSKEHFIRGLNFPDTAEDEDGFVSLRLALRDRHAAQIIRAAQDVLTLLSQEGIYMDDLRPDRARIDVWRQFAQGERGRTVAALGGVRDRTSLALTSARMKQDPQFREAAHLFLRRFDQMITRFEPDASDSEISSLSDTRTARAFMLLGRVAGTFD